MPGPITVSACLIWGFVTSLASNTSVCQFKNFLGHPKIENPQSPIKLYDQDDQDDQEDQKTVGQRSCNVYGSDMQSVFLFLH